MKNVFQSAREVKLKNTPEQLTHVYSNEVFVFGSNESGYHGGGAARLALDFGAVYHKGVGLYGNTYAIPTKDFNVETLPLVSIKKYVDDFIEFAKNNPDKIFLVTKIGCGLAGYTVHDIAPLFVNAIGIENVVLPEEFEKK